MLADLLYSIFPYQIFKSIAFRSGAGFLTTYILVIAVMPCIVRLFRRKKIVSEYSAYQYDPHQPYAGPKPFMGGLVLILGVMVSLLLWIDFNQFIIALLIIFLAFGLIGACDDLMKLRMRNRVEQNKMQRKEYSSKADGISSRLKLLAELLVSVVAVIILYRHVNIDGHLVVPLIPMDWWYPYLPRYVFIPLMIFIIIGGANSTNILDGMDSLATIPLLTGTLFVAVIAYIGTDAGLAQGLKIPLLPAELREMVVFAACFISAGLAFLKFNTPPAHITMGDVGSLAFGSTFATMFIFVKAELFLPIVALVPVLVTLSSIIQNLFFKIMLRLKGRETAKKFRFFYKAPYHHHLHEQWLYVEGERPIKSAWAMLLTKLGIKTPKAEDQLCSRDLAASRVIWNLHLLSIIMLVVASVIYFKVR